MINDNLNSFDFSPEVLDEIQSNIEEIIKSFPISDGSKLDVIKKINFMYSQTRYMSVTDPLTGLYNRRYLENILEREFLRAKRYQNELSIAIFDIDFFKKFNDTYGHSCGDYVLKEAAYLMLNNFRQTDFVFRYGGEEFAVILTETSGENSLIPLERLRKTIEDYSFKFGGEILNVTISIGVSSNTDFKTPQEMFDDADRALYNAKNSGRNMVKSAGELI